jgi:DNA helicase-2/ATP-dependent DNA helicase PcrA
MFTSLSTVINAGREIEELRRLFYVGLTRAQKYLFLSYSRFKNDGKEMEPSMFIAEIRQEHDIPVVSKTITEEEMAAFNLLQFTAQAPEIQKSEDDFVTGLLEKFVMNVTALNNYLNCPLRFYYSSLIRIPSGKNEATEFGSAIHFALERFFREMKDTTPPAFPAKEKLISHFAWYLKKHRENFTQESFDRRMEYGLEVLEKYYDKYIHEWNKYILVELNVRKIGQAGVHR